MHIKLRVNIHFLIVFSIIHIITSSDTGKNGGFLLTMPKTLESGRNESVCLSLHHFRHPSKIVIDLKYKGNHFLTNRVIESGA